MPYGYRSGRAVPDPYQLQHWDVGPLYFPGQRNTAEAWVNQSPKCEHGRTAHTSYLSCGSKGMGKVLTPQCPATPEVGGRAGLEVTRVGDQTLPFAWATQ